MALGSRLTGGQHSPRGAEVNMPPDKILSFVYFTKIVTSYLIQFLPFIYVFI